MKKILIIEDNYDLAQNMMLFLRENNYDVRISYTGNEGLREIINFKPDMILCDIMLPGIDGYKILSELKKIDTIVLPILIYITARTQRSDLRKGMNLGADDYITKPFTFDELLSSVEAQFKKRTQYLTSLKHNNSNLDIPLKTKSSKVSLSKTKTLTHKSFLFIDNKKNPGIHAIKDLIVIRSFKDYTILFFVDGKKFLLRKQMNYWESHLPSDEFIRIHRQTLINLNYIDKVEKLSSNRFAIILKGYNHTVEVSQRYSKKIREVLV